MVRDRIRINYNFLRQLPRSPVRYGDQRRGGDHESG